MIDATHNALEGAMTMSGKPSGFRALVGYRCVVWTRDYAEMALAIAPEHTNSLGIVHGGVIMTIMDAAMGHAATWCAVEGNIRICVTLGLTTNFLAPVKSGHLCAIARLIGIHDRVATIIADVVDQHGGLVAAGQASFRYLPGSDSYDGVPRQTQPSTPA